MVAHIKIGMLNIHLVLRHRWEQEKKFQRTFTSWKLALWFRKNKIVGVKEFTHPDKWNNNLANCYQLGIEALVFRAWIELDFGGMHFDI